MTRKIRDAIIYALKALLNSALLASAIIIALALRFDLQPDAVPAEYVDALAGQIVYYLIINFLLFVLFSLYENLVETVGIKDLVKMVAATGVSSAAVFTISAFAGNLLPRSVYVLTWMLSIVFVGGCMVFLRVVKNAVKRPPWSAENHDRIMLVGANGNASTVVNYLSSGANMGRAVVIADHEGGKVGRRVKDVKIAGTLADIPRLAQAYKVNVIILCLDEEQYALRREAIQYCLETNCTLKNFVAPQDSLQSGANMGRQRFKSIDYSDLLERSEIKLDTEICGYIKGTTVLVTGGGGSIGSEICRQICLYKPERVVIFDVYENNAYDLELELRAKYGGYIDICVRIGSVRDPGRLDEIFDEFRPSVVFHAAAHKHVPLMEDSPCEAIKNNVFGTYNTATAAIKYGVNKFILLSTDKAVNATSVMGASKRLCELIIQSFRNEKTVFAAVRFGNVLGSNGSVVPLFRKQIEEGGPVTITHPDITRYFMTIPEAAQLVVQAGGHAEGGEIFILDMGEPVKILDLARNLIRLSGYEPGIDIKISFVGLRPGEKMFEELSYDSESTGTPNKKIFIAKPTDIGREQLERHLDRLRAVLENGGGEYGLREALNAILFDGSDDSPIFRREFKKKYVDAARVDVILEKAQSDRRQHI